MEKQKNKNQYALDQHKSMQCTPNNKACHSCTQIFKETLIWPNTQWYPAKSLNYFKLSSAGITNPFVLGV